MHSLRSRTVAWWVWVTGQAAIVGLYAGRIRPSGGYPTPIESTADLGLAVGQVVLGVLLAPLLFYDRRAAVHSATAAAVFSLLAGRLADRPMTESFWLLGAVMLWLSVARVWADVTPGRLAVLFLTVAGPVLFYGSHEYRPRPIALDGWLAGYSPVLGICSIRLHNAPWRTLLVAGCGLAGGILTRQWSARRSGLYCKP